MKTLNTLRTVVVLVTTTLLSFAATASTAPLLMEGKQALYQRVLAIPGSQLSTAPTAEASIPVTPFTAFYVYARQQAGGTEWLQVGTNRHGEITGWLPVADSIDWNQGLTVAFKEPTDHKRALLFRDRDSIQQLVETGDRKRYEELLAAAENGVITSDSPVAAIQPPGKLDILEDFYLVPIRRHEDVYLDNEQARLLQVTSVPLNTQDVTKPSAPTAGDRGYSAGLTFVIDSTLSMGPYIKRTREAVMKIYDSLSEANLLGNVNFGLIAFRDSPTAAPDLEYLARNYVTLNQGRDPSTFLKQVDGLTASRASSVDFVEDAYAGVKKAIDEMEWDEHAARYIVLITDAGPRDADDPLASTGLDARALQKMARDKGIAIFVMHLLTSAEQADNAKAATQYRTLSRFPGIGSLYYGVPTGDVREFGHVLDTLSGQITMQVQMAGASQPAPPVAVENDANPQLTELQGKVEKLGYALRMRYLQTTEGDRPPRIFNAWLLDRDFLNPEQRALDVQVLLTRDQLSDLHDILRQVLQTAEDGLLSPQNFLNELKSLAATIARDPEQLGETTATTAGTGNSLADLGFMREYIEDLPYTGEVMSLSLDDWAAWPAREQIAFLHRLEDKIDYYRALHDHPDLWVSLDAGPVDGDSVFPLPLDMLP